MTRLLLAAALLGCLTSVSLGQDHASDDRKAAPLTIGETFTIESKALGEPRRVNVYLPPSCTDRADARCPVLYMPDGGLGEDFLHIAGLVQVSVGNATMRPFVLVGIENTQRRRDLTGPTENAADRKIAPQVGESASFRRFIRSELIPTVKTRYRTTAESAVIGESLAGLFVVETLLTDPDLFDIYVAVDPSVWWNDAALVKSAPRQLSSLRDRAKTLYLASSRDDRGDLTRELATVLRSSAPPSLKWVYQPMPEETHATIYHPAALAAVRRVLAPVAK
jgi:predicted alpha/beta superfamily hydrolase